MANVYGPRQDPHGEAGVVAIFAGARAEGRPVVVYGDGRQTRDYIYVSDVVDAWLAAAATDVTGVLNVSTGVEVTLLELIEEMGVTHELAPPRPGEIARSCLDPSAARSELGWRPRVPLADGVARTLESLGAAHAERGAASSEA